MSDLQHAIDHLGAKEVAPGKFVRQGLATLRWFLVTPETIAEFAEALERYDQGDATPNELALILSDDLPLPQWWSPERRAVWRHNVGCAIADRTTTHRCECGQDHPCSCGSTRITASLETGEEIPS